MANVRTVSEIVSSKSGKWEIKRYTKTLSKNGTGYLDSLQTRFDKPRANHTASEDNTIAGLENESFESDDSLTKPSKTFPKVVRTLTEYPIEEDFHPYGRGPLYRSVITDKHLPKFRRSEGKFIMWCAVTFVIAGIAVCVIIMAQMYQLFHQEKTAMMAKHNSSLNM